MEVRSHGMENFNVNRESDKAVMSFNPDYVAQTGNSSVATTTPMDVVPPTASVTNIVSTSTVVSGSTTLTTDCFSFPSLTNDLNVPPYESPDASQAPLTEHPTADATGGSPIFEIATKEPAVIFETVQEEYFSHSANEESSTMAGDVETQSAVMEEPFDDMVVLQDGMVTVPGAVEEHPAPIVEGARDSTELATPEFPQIPEVGSQVSVGKSVEDPVTGEVHLQQPNGAGLPQTDVLEHPITDESPMQHFKGDAVYTEGTVETLSGEGPSEQFKANATLLENLNEPTAVAVTSDHPMADEAGLEKVQHEDLQQEAAIELPADKEPPEKERELSEKEQAIDTAEEVLYETEPTEKKQDITETGPSITGKPEEGAGDLQAPSNTQTSEKPSEETELKETSPIKKDEAKPEASQQDAEGLKGRQVLKRFGKKNYMGEIKGYDTDTKWFKVEYEDGDEEDLEWVELQLILVPVDFKPESLLKKRARASVGTDGDERTPKKVKKSAAGTPGKRTYSKSKKTPPSSKAKGRGSKKGSSSKLPATKGKAVQTKRTASGKSSSRRKSKGKGTRPLQGSSAKNTGSKTKQNAKVAEGADGAPIKTPEEKGNQQQQMVTPKSGVSAKKNKRSRKKGQKPKMPEMQKVVKDEFEQKIGNSAKSGKKTSAGKRTTSAGKRAKAGRKRKADMEESRVSLGKRLKRVATGNIESNVELQSGHTTQSKQGAVEADEANMHELGGGISMIGRMARKKFGGKYYKGKVVGFDNRMKYYKVEYDDGDMEDLEWGELKPLLVSEADSTDKHVKKDVPARSALQEKKGSTPQAKSKGGKRGGNNKAKTSRIGAVTRSKGGK